MPMKNPPHPGLLVKDNLDELGLTVAIAAKGFGVTRPQFYRVVNAQSAVSPEMAVRLEKAFGGTAGAWLRMQAAFDLSQVRKRGSKIVVTRFAAKAAGRDASSASPARRETAPPPKSLRPHHIFPR